MNNYGYQFGKLDFASGISKQALTLCSRRNTRSLCGTLFLLSLAMLTSAAPVDAGPAASSYEIHKVVIPGSTLTQLSDITNSGTIVVGDEDFGGTYDLRTGEFDLSEGLSIAAMNESGLYGGGGDGFFCPSQLSLTDKRGDVTLLPIPTDPPFPPDEGGSAIGDIPVSFHIFCQLGGIAPNGLTVGWVFSVDLDGAATWRSWMYDPLSESFQVVTSEDLPNNPVPASDALQFRFEGVNAKGQVVGNYRELVGASLQVNYGLLREPDGYIRLFRVMTPDGVLQETAARGISDDGIIVGQYFADDGDLIGWVGRLSHDRNNPVLIPDAIFALNDDDDLCPADYGVSPQAINNKGIIIAGCARESPNMGHGLVLRPIPSSGR